MSLKKITTIPIFFLFCSIITFVWFYWPDIIHAQFPDWKTQELGDKFGGLTTLFTGLAFAGLVFTILLQKVQIKDAEEEQFQQRFDATFFQLLNNINQIIESIEIRDTKTEHIRKNRLALYKMFEIFDEDYLQNQGVSHLDGKDKVVAAYSEFYSYWDTNLGHYYRVYYYIFKFVDKSQLQNSEKRKYANILRAQFSSEQLLLLFYNCFVREGFGFKYYVNKYTLFKHLPKGQIRDQSLLDYYDKSAYTDPEDMIET
jgi:hypothetical protein